MSTRADAELLEVADHALVVDDLAEGVGRLAGRGDSGPCRSPPARRSRSRCGSRCGPLDGSHVASSIAHGGRSRPLRATWRRQVSGAGPAVDGGRVDAPVAGSSSAAIRPMIRSSRAPWRRRGRRRRDDVGEPGTAHPTRTRDLAAGRQRELAALRPDPVRVVDADRDDRAPVRSASIARPSLASWSAPVGAARALGKHQQDVAGVEDPAPAGRPRRPRPRGRPGGYRRARASQPMTGQSKISRLPSQWIRRVRRAGVSQRPDDDRVGVRDVVDGEDHGPVARDASGPRSRDPADRRTRRAHRDAAVERITARGRDRDADAISASMHGRRGRGSLPRAAGRARTAFAARGAGLGRRRVASSAAGLGARRTVAGRHGLARWRLDARSRRRVVLEGLPSVRMTTASSAARSGATGRLLSRWSRRRSCSRTALGLARPPGPGHAPRSGARARSSTDASRNSFRSASGSTTVPMSRPAMTIPPAAASARWRARSAARTSGTRETARHRRVDRPGRATLVGHVVRRRRGPGAGGPAVVGRASTRSARGRRGAGVVGASALAGGARPVRARYRRPVSKKR